MTIVMTNVIIDDSCHNNRHFSMTVIIKMKTAPIPVSINISTFCLQIEEQSSKCLGNASTLNSFHQGNIYKIIPQNEAKLFFLQTTLVRKCESNFVFSTSTLFFTPTLFFAKMKSCVKILYRIHY